VSRGAARPRAASRACPCCEAIAPSAPRAAAPSTVTAAPVTTRTARPGADGSGSAGPSPNQSVSAVCCTEAPRPTRNLVRSTRIAAGTSARGRPAGVARNIRAACSTIVAVAVMAGQDSVAG
jgi:hypothetical protein